MRSIPAALLLVLLIPATSCSSDSGGGEPATPTPTAAQPLPTPQVSDTPTPATPEPTLAPGALELEIASPFSIVFEGPPTAGAEIGRLRACARGGPAELQGVAFELQANGNVPIQVRLGERALLESGATIEPGTTFTLGASDRALASLGAEDCADMVLALGEALPEATSWARLDLVGAQSDAELRLLARRHIRDDQERDIFMPGTHAVLRSRSRALITQFPWPPPTRGFTENQRRVAVMTLRIWTGPDEIYDLGALTLRLESDEALASVDIAIEGIRSVGEEVEETTVTITDVAGDRAAPYGLTLGPESSVRLSLVTEIAEPATRAQLFLDAVEATGTLEVQRSTVTPIVPFTGLVGALFVLGEEGGGGGPGGLEDPPRIVIISELPGHRAGDRVSVSPFAAASPDGYDFMRLRVLTPQALRVAAFEVRADGDFGGELTVEIEGGEGPLSLAAGASDWLVYPASTDGLVLTVRAPSETPPEDGRSFQLRFTDIDVLGEIPPDFEWAPIGLHNEIRTGPELFSTEGQGPLLDFFQPHLREVGERVAITEPQRISLTSPPDGGVLLARYCLTAEAGPAQLRAFTFAHNSLKPASVFENLRVESPPLTMFLISWDQLFARFDLPDGVELIIDDGEERCFEARGGIPRSTATVDMTLVGVDALAPFSEAPALDVRTLSDQTLQDDPIPGRPVTIVRD